MFQLKQYQQRCLDELAAFFRKINKHDDANLAFYAHTKRPYIDIEDLPGLPYVCIRVPTGGGKTVMAAHAVGLATKNLLRTERSLVLWLAPTTQIVTQTINALRDKRHPYRQALDAAFAGRLTVTDLPSALSLTPANLASDTTIVVSTIQAPRVDAKEGRKIYAEDNGSLMDHFTNLQPEQLALLDKTEAGAPACSLSNVFRLHRPIIIVDEAHNARTPLSFETLARFNPSCIVEFTATPRADSNVLKHVSAAELKAEEMIKLPVRLRTRPEWQEAVKDTLRLQTRLEDAAQKEQAQTGEYIRPIVLFQAQRHGDRNITFEVLKKSLTNDFKVPPDQIAIATGAKNDIEKIDLSDPQSPVRYIITVEKLREGWDCPFAYILCSVSNLSSRTAVEQIMGRVLRMPHAHRKLNDALNHSYAFVTSQDFKQAANALTDALTDSGFDRYEARQSIKPDSQTDLPFPLPLWSQPVTELFPAEPEKSTIPTSLRKHIHVSVSNDSPGAAVSYDGPPITKKTETEWAKTLKDDQARNAVKRLARKSRGEDTWPAALGETFAVPMLAVRNGKQLELFEDQFRETFWKLSDCDPALTHSDFSLPTGPDTGAEIDVHHGKISWASFTETLHRQLTFFDTHGPTTAPELIAWLDRAFDHPDITQPEMTRYLDRVLDYLQTQRGFTLNQLITQRFRLRDSVADKVSSLRRTSTKQIYDQMLLPDFDPPVEANPDACFTFPLNQYPAPDIYHGKIVFHKHYYELPAAMNGEEADCAAHIESLPEVKAWVRNLTTPQHAFWLQTSSDKFYPDFVAKLTDDRLLVVEYKGSHLVTADDAKDKQLIGQTWEARSNGRCLFLMLTDRDFTAIDRKIRPTTN